MVVWEDHYSIGNAEIDFQHQHIMALINAVEVAATSGEGSDNMDLVLSHLVDYLARHFAAEERLMLSVGYPGLEAHRLEHQAFSQLVAGLLEGLQPGHVDLQRAMDLLIGWLHWHVLGSDQKFAPFVASRPEAVSRWTTAIQDEKDALLSGVL